MPSILSESNFSMAALNCGKLSVGFSAILKRVLIFLTPAYVGCRRSPAQFGDVPQKLGSCNIISRPEGGVP